MFSPMLALWTLVVTMVAQNVTDNVISPKVMQSSVQVHPIMSLTALVIGSALMGPIGMVIADSLLGEITPAMAQAVAQSDARRILIPANRCDTLVVGVSAPIGTLVEQAAAAVLDGCRN